MTQKLLAMMAAIAVAGVFVTPEAEAATPREFKAALAAKIGNKTNLAAYNAASRVLGTYSQDDPGKVKTWASLTQRALKKVAVPSSVGVTKLLKQMTTGIFKAINYTVNNNKLNAGIKLLVKKLPRPEKKESKIDRLFKVFRSLNNRQNGTVPDLQAWANLVYRAAGLTPPIIS